MVPVVDNTTINVNNVLIENVEGYVSVSVSASYCIPQCVRLIAGVCTHYVVYNIRAIPCQINHFWHFLGRPISDFAQISRAYSHP